jgi:hypothetical protein
MKKNHAVTNKSNEKETPILPKGKKPEAELSEADLDKVTGGAIDSYVVFQTDKGGYIKGESQ